MNFRTIPGLSALGQPRITSIYDETGTADSGYDTRGPYHCEDCLHKTAPDEPFCIHPRVIGDLCLQDQLVMIDGRPAIKIDMGRGCCRYVHPPMKSDSSKDGDDDEDDE